MAQRTEFFLSLKWKVLIIFGCILLISHSAQYFLSYHQLTQQFENQRKQERQYQITLVQQLIEQSSRLMEQAAETVPLLLQNQVNEKNILTETLDQYWNNQQANWGLSAVYQYNAKQQLDMHWGEALENIVSKKQINLAFQAEKPLTVLACAKQCFQLVYIPTLTGVSVLVRSFADIILAFDEITGNDLAILNPTLATKKPQNLSLQMSASSHPNKVRPIFQQAIFEFDTQTLFKKESIITDDSGILGIQLFHLSAPPKKNSPILLLVTDLTEKNHQMEQARKNSLEVILVALALSTILLFTILLRHTKRIISISSALPALSKGAHQKVREILKKPATFRFPFQDELDSLISSALLVSNQLEDNKKQIDKNTTLLTVQNKKIAQDHQYVSELLDTAPVIILNQTKDGEITSINKLGCDLLKAHPQQLINKNFEIFFAVSEYKKDGLNLSSFRNSSLDTFEQDTITKGHDANVRTIAWVHKNIFNQSGAHSSTLSVGQDITDRKVAEGHLVWMVDHDPLTNIFNRRYFLHTFEQQLKVAERYGERGAILFLDLDQFKYVNDTSGHKSGDELLIIVSDTLKKITRTSDTLARLGGDEFAILIPETTTKGAIQLAVKILNELQFINFKPAGHTHNISASIGIITFPETGFNIHDIMANADLAMYHAKESGRGRWHLFRLGDQAREKLTERVLWKEKIESAISESRLIFHYQPILDIKTNKITHTEALIRMINHEGDLIMPGDFIPVAEQTGLINQIDIIVLKLAIETLQLLHATKNPLKLSINLSGKAFDNPELLKYLKKELTRSDINAEQLIIEVTETTAIENFSAAKSMMSEITSKGVQFALDDFGVGFSSFQHLRHLHVAYVKIDGSFIRQLGQQKEDQILVQAIADIAKTSGKKTIAEFVENQNILDLVETYGIDYAQGYHIAKPSSELPS